MDHTQCIRETPKCNSGQKRPGLSSPPEHHLWERPCQKVCDLPMYPTKQVSTAFISTPEHLCALLEVSMEQRSRLHVHCCDRDTQLCSAKSRTAQAIHSSHKQPPLAMCMLMAPHFLPPAAVTSRVPVTQPSGIPPVCPCSGEQWCGTDPATPAGNEKHGCQQLLHKNGHACMWRKARHQ